MGASDSYQLARRRFLQAGTLALFAGAAPAGVARGFTPASNDGTPSFGRAKRCILVYLLGGPPQIDMWDMKPDAPAEIRGPFKSIASAVPGMRFCEHLPRLAARADDLAILRSVTFPNNDHPAMIYHSLTGRESRVPLGANTVLPPSRSDDPHLGAVVARFKHRRTDAPGYVAIPEVQVRKLTTPVAGGGRAGFLARRSIRWRSTTIRANRSPGSSCPRDCPGERFAARQSLLTMLDGRAPRAAASRDYRHVSRIGRAAHRLRGGRRHVQPFGRVRRRRATVTAGTALVRACCWPGDWSSTACRLSACTSIT